MNLKPLLTGSAVFASSLAVASAQEREPFQASWQFSESLQSLTGEIEPQRLNESTAAQITSNGSLTLSEGWVSITNADRSAGTTWLQFELTNLSSDLEGLEFSSQWIWSTTASQVATISGWTFSMQDRESGAWTSMTEFQSGSLTPRSDRSTTGVNMSGLVLQDFTSVSGIRLQAHFANGGQGGNNSGNALSVSSVTFTGTVSAIPEPSTYAAIFGGLVLGIAFVARRRKAARLAA